MTDKLITPYKEKCMKYKIGKQLELTFLYNFLKRPLYIFAFGVYNSMLAYSVYMLAALTLSVRNSSP